MAAWQGCCSRDSPARTNGRPCSSLRGRSGGTSRSSEPCVRTQDRLLSSRLSRSSRLWRACSPNGSSRGEPTLRSRRLLWQRARLCRSFGLGDSLADQVGFRGVANDGYEPKVSSGLAPRAGTNFRIRSVKGSFMVSCLIVAVCAISGMIVGDWLGFDRTAGFISGAVAGALLARFASSRRKW